MSQPIANSKLLDAYQNPKYDMVPPTTGRWAATSVMAVTINSMRMLGIV